MTRRATPKVVYWQHITSASKSAISEWNAYYTTLLRDPTKLVLSFYFWQKKMRYQGMGDWTRYTPDVPYEDLPLEDFLRKYEYIWANMCCKQICNIERVNESPWDIMRSVISLSGRQLYHRARDVIQRRFSFVGLSERFSASLVALHILRGHDRVYLGTRLQASGVWRFPTFIRG